MADVSNGPQADDSQLRERPSAKPLHLNNADDAKQKVLELNDQEDKNHKDDGKKRTYGRTPDGTGTSQPVLYGSHGEYHAYIAYPFLP
jgi:phosphatidylethanolamine N-methyltransferase